MHDSNWLENSKTLNGENKCWAQPGTKVTPTSDDLLTSNLFYSRITIERNKKFEFEGILIIISILF